MGIIERADDHMNKMSAMMRKTDVDLTNLDGPGGDAFLRGSILRCLFCGKGEQCQSWLGEAEDHSAPPSFCPNATRFEAFREANS